MDFLTAGIRGLLAKRSQISLTVCGIAIGVFSVLVISAIGSTGQAIIGQELEKLGFDCITVSASQKELNTMGPDDLVAVAALEEVAVAAPLNTSIGRVVMRDYAGEVLLCGVDQNARQIIQLELKNGRFFQESDIAAGANLCVVDEKLAHSFYKRTNIVGKEMSITVDQGTETFTVIGVVDGESNLLNNLAGGYVPSFVYIPYTAHQSLCRGSAIDQLFVKAAPGTEPETAGERIAHLLNVSAGYRNLYRYEDLAVQKDRLDSILSGATLALSAIGGISLLVSGLSIMTIMTVSVQDRTREIGIKRAVGARTIHILGEFIGEAVLLTLAGSLLGVLASQLLTFAAGRLLGLPLGIAPGMVLGTLGFSVVVGAVFGVRPARLAARLRPVDALRYE